MGRGTSESTLRIDEPLHFMFLVAYLITYFCCAYLLFICFKHCRRLWRKKPSRPGRVRNVGEILNSFHERHVQSRLLPTQVTVSVHGNTVCSQICEEGPVGRGENIRGDQISLQSNFSENENTETNTSILSPFNSPMPIYSRNTSHFSPQSTPSGSTRVILNCYESGSDEEEPPPSYSECVLNQIPKIQTPSLHMDKLDNNKPHHLIQNVFIPNNEINDLNSKNLPNY